MSTRINLDLRDVPFPEHSDKVLRAAAQTGDAEYLHVQAREISWPLMADLRMDGLTYQVVNRAPDAVEFKVWPRLTADQRRRYLRDRLRPRRADEGRFHWVRS